VLQIILCRWGGCVLLLDKNPEIVGFEIQLESNATTYGR
jgi:hypothetical protein